MDRMEEQFTMLSQMMTGLKEVIASSSEHKGSEKKEVPAAMATGSVGGVGSKPTTQPSMLR